MNVPTTVGRQSIKGTIELHFVVKFFPEEITHELIQDITRHLFYRHVKQDILNMNIYCPPDTAAHLASLALQAKVISEKKQQHFFAFRFQLISSVITNKSIHRSISKMKLYYLCHAFKRSNCRVQIGSIKS